MSGLSKRSILQSHQFITKASQKAIFEQLERELEERKDEEVEDRAGNQVGDTLPAEKLNRKSNFKFLNHFLIYFLIGIEFVESEERNFGLQNALYITIWIVKASSKEDRKDGGYNQVSEV